MRFVAVFFALVFLVPLLLLVWRGRARSSETPDPGASTVGPHPDKPFEGYAGGGWGV